MYEWLGFVIFMGIAGMLVFAGLVMGLWAMAAGGRFDGDAFAALLMLVLGAWLGHAAWVHAPFTVVLK